MRERTHIECHGTATGQKVEFSTVGYYRLIGGGNAYAPTDFLTIGNAQFPTPIL